MMTTSELASWCEANVRFDGASPLMEIADELRRLESNQLPELNEKEQAALDSLPDDLVEHLINGEQWDSLNQCYVPTREALVAALWKIRRLTQQPYCWDRIVDVVIDATKNCDEPVALSQAKETTDE